MVYTNNVPQANQQIANTQAPIQANFQFLQTGLSQEHFFSAGGTGSNMTHTKASMANLSTPEVLPAFTNGMYYVLGGDAKFLANDGVKCELTKGTTTAAKGSQWIGRVLVNWGFEPASVGDTSGESYAEPFPNACFMVIGNLARIANPTYVNSADATLVVGTNSGSKTSFRYAISGSNFVPISGFYWLAIGN